MNRSNFNQTGGYPLKTERLQEQQKAFEIFNAFGALAGNLTIISGCNTVGSTVQDGFIYINGEIIEFRQADGSGASTVIIIEEPVNASFENGTVKTVYYNRYATFGTSETSWLWSDFKRPFETKNIPGDLNTQLGAIPGKAETTTVTDLTARVTALENALTLIKTPQIKIWSGFETVTSWTSAGDFSNTFSRNYVDVFPPAGYTMAHFQGMVPSISQIKFSGDVNEDDVLWCKWQTLTDRVRIMCGDSEMRAAPMINHLSVWIK